MKYLIIILLIFFSVDAIGQTRPSGNPTQFNTGWQRWGFSMSDSGTILARRDTNFLPRFSGTMVYRPADRLLYYYDSTELRWKLIASQGSAISAANNGLSLSGSTVQLGQSRSGGGSAGALLNSREIPMADSSIYWTNGLFNITADHQVSGALPILNVQSTSSGFHEMAQFKSAGATEVHARTTSPTGYASFLTSINGSLKLTIGSDGNATHNFIQLKNGYDIYIEDDASSPFAVFGANDNISLGVNGTTRYVGVGVSSPSYKLDINNDKTSSTTNGDRVLNVSDNGTTYNTSSSAITNYTAFINSSATRSSGGNDLTNIALNVSASGAQVNQALVAPSGDVVVGVVSDADTYVNIAHAQTVNNGSSTQRHGELQVTRSMVFNDTLSGTEGFSAVQRIASRFRAKQSYTIADELHGSPLEAQYNLLRNAAYTGAVTYQGSIAPMNNVTTMPSVLVARMNMSTVQSGANSVRARGFWAGVTSAVYLNTGNRIDNFAFFNGGAGQWTDGTIDTAYIYYANPLPSLVGVKYAIKQVGTADSVSIAGITRHSNLSAQTDTTNYKPMVVSSNGVVSKMSSWPSGSASFVVGRNLRIISGTPNLDTLATIDSLITATAALADSSTKAASTAWVKEQGYGSGGTTYTFTSGLTNTAGTVSNDFFTGKSGGLTVKGGTAADETLSLQGNTAASSNTATNANIQFKVGNSGGTTAATIFNNGNVSIGNTSSSEKLSVTGNIAASGNFQLAGVTLLQFSGNDLLISGTSGGNISIRKDATAVYTYINSTATHNFIGEIAFSTKMVLAGVDLITWTGSEARVGSVTAGFNDLTLWAAGVSRATLNSTGFGIGATPAAVLTLKAGTSSANTAPLKFTAGTLNTTAEAFTKEASANSFYATKNSGLRYAEGGAIADFTSDVSNSGTGETDLYTYTTPASTLAATGEQIEFEGAGTFSDITATVQLQFYFAGTNIGNTTALTIGATGAFVWKVSVIRTGASTARASVTVNTNTGTTTVYTAETDLTSLTFTNTNIIKITGTAGGGGGGTGDITAKKAKIWWWGASSN